MLSRTEKTFFDHIVVGAGLSGLTAAYSLVKDTAAQVLLLESRPRVGGRIFTHDMVDFGATWFQGHHGHVLNLLEELGIGKFCQYSKGNSILVYNSLASGHFFESDADAPSAFRISPAV